jgi:sulfide:quinone oxidoreductase
MKKLVILGSGAGGVMCATKLRHKLDESEWKITVIDRSLRHHYQAGWLFVPFGIYDIKDCIKPQMDFVPRGVDFVLDEITNIDPAGKVVTTRNGRYEYDWIIIATGCRVVPEEVEGLMDVWNKDAFTFYTPEGAVALARRMRHFNKGKLVLHIAEMPIKCPVAPLEFVFLADWFYMMNDSRCNVEIELVTPLTGAFTKPVASATLTKLCEEKNIRIVPNFEISHVNADAHTIESVKGEEVAYDLLVTIPPNLGSQVIMDAEIGNVMGYMETDHYTLKSKKHANMYIIGDATDVPTSKAGSVAHYQSDIVVENVLREIDGLTPMPEFDGHSTCFIVSGHEKAVLIDFNYKVEPLPGKYPFPGLGPMSLLEESYLNYWGKMMFKWVYFNLMLKGKELPLEPQMFMAGKKRLGTGAIGI